MKFSDLVHGQYYYIIYKNSPYMVECLSLTNGTIKFRITGIWHDYNNLKADLNHTFLVNFSDVKFITVKDYNNRKWLKPKNYEIF